MWLGIGLLGGLLSLTGHQLPLLAKQVTRSSIKEQLNLIHIVWMMN